MEYLLLAVALAAVLMWITHVRHRPSEDPVKSVESFRRAVKALNPNRRSRRR